MLSWCRCPSGPTRDLDCSSNNCTLGKQAPSSHLLGGQCAAEGAGCRGGPRLVTSWLGGGPKT
eukprot:5730647-Alexandrium_andersonii.AAC.1